MCRGAPDRERAARRVVEASRVIGSPGFPRDGDWPREVAGLSYDRAHDAAGIRRRLAALL